MTTFASRGSPRSHGSLLPQNALGFKSFELRGGVYFLASPNIQILSPSSPLVRRILAGAKGSRCNAVSPRVQVKAELGSKWIFTVHQRHADLSQRKSDPGRIHGNRRPVLPMARSALRCPGRLPAQALQLRLRAGLRIPQTFRLPVWHIAFSVRASSGRQGNASLVRPAGV